MIKGWCFKKAKVYHNYYKPLKKSRPTNRPLIFTIFLSFFRIFSAICHDRLALLIKIDFVLTWFTNQMLDRIVLRLDIEYLIVISFFPL